MHDAFVALRVVNDLLDQAFVCQFPVHCIDYQRNTLMSATNAHRVNRFEPARTHHLSLKAQNFENVIFTFRCFSLKAVCNSCNSCKLPRLLQVAKFFIMYYFTQTNIHKGLLPD